MNPNEAARLKQEYGLSYHVDFVMNCENRVSFAGKDVLEVGGHLPERFVFEALKARSWTGIDLETDKKMIYEGKAYVPAAGEYDVCGCRIEDFPERYYGAYDLIFSIACFEHIIDLPQAIVAMRNLLKPGGKLFTQFSPIWSAHDGHHLPTITDKNGKSYNFGNSPIPPWGHLLMRPFEMHEYLCQFLDAPTASQFIYHIYYSDGINRIFAEEYFELFRKSLFSSGNGEVFAQTQVPPEIQRKLKEKYPQYNSFAYNGIIAVLTK